MTYIKNSSPHTQIFMLCFFFLDKTVREFILYVCSNTKTAFWVKNIVTEKYPYGAEYQLKRAARVAG